MIKCLSLLKLNTKIRLTTNKTPIIPREILVINSSNLNNVGLSSSMEFNSHSSNNNQSFSKFEFYQTFVLPIHNKFEK